MSNIQNAPTNNFIDFIEDNNIFITIIATLLSSNINKMANSLVQNIVMPILDFDLNNDGKPDKKKLENIVISFKGINIRIGRFLVSLFEFCFMVYVLYIITKFFKKTKFR